MALSTGNIQLLDEACKASRERRMMARTRGSVRVTVTRLASVVIELTGDSVKAFDDWKAACKQRSLTGEAYSERAAGAAEIRFTPKPKRK